ncbi:hypothetical protein [Borreliella lanei]|uniref:Uncharacterized protein n=1 Tax=Borreliella lanei TaxID=373540 RepID=A0A7W9ZA90_9SPIR|nr:hypothetical protein [Borreliella lanei]MBB6207515.1 hypothetical protein [Borreliella lanei]WKC86650.1 hypothetical protein QIA23_04790 [Borreliella lanei]
MCSRLLSMLFVICFLSCGLYKNNKDPLLQDVVSEESINTKLDWKSTFGLNNEECNTLAFFINTLKSELAKTSTETHHFNIYLKGDVSQIEEYIKRFLFKLKDRGKVKELINYIKYGRDNQPNVAGKDENNGGDMDAKEHHKLESRLASAFNHYFMLLNPPSPTQEEGNNNNVALDNNTAPPTINSDPENTILNEIKKVCYEFRSSEPKNPT